jgi:hypothetical protein
VNPYYIFPGYLSVRFIRCNISLPYYLFLTAIDLTPGGIVHYTFTHKQYTEYRERNIHNNQKKKNGKCGPCPVFASYTLAFALQLRKKHGKTSVRIVDIPVAVVQYTFTHKQYTEQHNETEYTERNVHNNNT